MGSRSRVGERMYGLYIRFLSVVPGGKSNFVISLYLFSKVLSLAHLLTNVFQQRIQGGYYGNFWFLLKLCFSLSHHGFGCEERELEGFRDIGS